MNWKELTTTQQLEEIDELSASKPVLIFKHSTRCSISSASLNRLERKWDAGKAGGVEVYFLDLIANRELSDEIAGRYGVEHQSPQVLLIKNGSAAYDNSHLGITFDELAEHFDPVSA